MLVAYHAHTQATLTAWDAALAQSKGNAAQLDCGHYVAGTGLSPIPVIEKLHDRMANMHLKDRTTPGSRPYKSGRGTGDTPLERVEPFRSERPTEEQAKFPERRLNWSIRFAGRRG